MFGQPTFRSAPSRLDQLVRNLRDLESRVRRLDPRDATRASDDFLHSVGSVLEDIADRFRAGSGYATKEAGRLGQRAGLAGRDSYEFLKGEVGAHPLAVLGIAAGIGLLIGVSLYQRSGDTTPAAKPRRRTKRRARK